MTPDWLLDETANAGRENLDPDHVLRYDSKMDASAALEVELLVELGLSSGSSLVEFGVGTGQFTFPAAAMAGSVVAVDVSPPMLDLVRKRIDKGKVSNIDVAVAGFLSYDYAPASIDFVYSRLALHHLPDFWKVHALQRIFDMLKPGGVFRLWDVVYNFDQREMPPRMEEWCSTGTDVAPLTPVEGGWGRWEIAEHVRDEHSTYDWLLEAMFERVGFVIERADKPDPVTATYVLRKPT